MEIKEGLTPQTQADPAEGLSLHQLVAGWQSTLPNFNVSVCPKRDPFWR